MKLFCKYAYQVTAPEFHICDFHFWDKNECLGQMELAERDGLQVLAIHFDLSKTA